MPYSKVLPKGETNNTMAWKIRNDKMLLRYQTCKQPPLVCGCNTLRRRNTRYKNINLSRKVFVDVSRFSPCVINLSRNKNICCGLTKVVAKSKARVYFEQHILALLLVFHQIHILSRSKFARAQANQPISVPHFFNL